ncbi:histone deacetylase 6 isoform X1 [Anthonomus grandis grandis]|uniref:histone deacetylase 6 isoform X1 n=1 Tax=Anthonomus grandis grandis TaxID=2921223 RepID=UPI002165EF1C|nr:histone deacetylase 6 isoform X1 [Anthonomus grandis grandis]XP_050314873.1 histone deacetylase 6 isoform X1 [Anthonomus grandis grandis]XP_050314875.1 histone deacetylase 6 isoform X1 [Anthonomus grandis grandis]XP_050314876.1 histone deacetylase 6 isoform X1 [Anthonomus grandis grandis]XP_050314877.1 histone deacetylase 6 isoform X1 [Anthonomus grandis grandis]
MDGTPEQESPQSDIPPKMDGTLEQQENPQGDIPPKMDGTPEQQENTQSDNIPPKMDGTPEQQENPQSYNIPPKMDGTLEQQKNPQGDNILPRMDETLKPENPQSDTIPEKVSTSDKLSQTDGNIPENDEDCQENAQKQSQPELPFSGSDKKKRRIKRFTYAKPLKSISPRQDLIEYIRQQKSLLNKKSDDQTAEPLRDPFSKTEKMRPIMHRSCAYGYVPSLEHKCPWDERHPEKPDRAVEIDKKLRSLYPILYMVDLEDTLEYHKDLLVAINLVHELRHDIALGKICEVIDEVHTRPYLSFLSDLFEQEEPGAVMYDSIYYNEQHSIRAALDAARMAITIARKVATGEVLNGFANIRPPGHHACDVPNGYCFLNNVAIAAVDLLRNNLAEKILIVDFDVHHGQGTQRTFYNSDKVLYFSVHRYELGTFWPNLKESNFDYIGEGKGKGFNINVPLNETCLRDFEYMCIILNLLLPVAYEFNPDIVLVSAGYDCIVGDYKGRMNVTPAMYSHLISLLTGIAEGKIAVFLEGGYFIPSLVQGAYKTVQALRYFIPGHLMYSESLMKPVVDVVNDVKTALRPYWKCFKMDPSTDVEHVVTTDLHNYHVAVSVFIGKAEEPPYPSRGAYPTLLETQKVILEFKLLSLQDMYFKTDRPVHVGFIENLLASERHVPPEYFPNTQEVPNRVVTMIAALQKYELLHRLITVTADPLLDDPIKTSMLSDQTKLALFRVHPRDYVAQIATGEGMEIRPDLYVTPQESLEACLQSCASICHIIRDIKEGKYRHGVAILRPPGHHAKQRKPGGFCLINQVVVGARFAIDFCLLPRVLIVDFDIHHGNGTQELTYDSKEIMYISIHRYDNKTFFPNEEAGNYTNIGVGPGRGYNMNIAFNNAKMGNADYLFTWLKAVVPLAYAFDPNLIIISAGFDACVHDPLGGYNVHPELFGHLVNTIKNVAPTVLSLEGGYHFQGSALSMVCCVRALLGDPIPMPELGEIHPEAAEATYRTLTVMRPFWPIFDTCKILDKKVRTPEELDETIKNADRAFSNLHF